MTVQKILVVDDSKTELFFMKDLLTKNGYQVVTAENAEQTHAALATGAKPDLIWAKRLSAHPCDFQRSRDSRYPNHHVHEQKSRDRPCLGNAPRRARLHHQASECR
jgi:hypothetical protein